MFVTTDSLAVAVRAMIGTLGYVARKKSSLAYYGAKQVAIIRTIARFSDME